MLAALRQLLRIFGILAFFFVLEAAAVVPGTLDPIGTARPNVAGSFIANDQPPGSFFQGFNPPYPTGDWWVGYGAYHEDA